MVIIILIATIVFIRWFYIEGNKLYKDDNKQITRKIDVALYKIQLGFISYFKAVCILILILAPAIITIIWRQQHQYDDDTFTILIVVSVAVFGLGVVLCVVLIGLFGHGCSLPFMRWAVTRRGLWLWPLRTWQDAS